jgi:hypothetical protein
MTGWRFHHGQTLLDAFFLDLSSSLKTWGCRRRTRLSSRTDKALSMIGVPKPELRVREPFLAGVDERVAIDDREIAEDADFSQSVTARSGCQSSKVA